VEIIAESKHVAVAVVKVVEVVEVAEVAEVAAVEAVIENLSQAPLASCIVLSPIRATTMTFKYMANLVATKKMNQP
jgi:hypothetical protein